MRFVVLNVSGKSDSPLHYHVPVIAVQRMDHGTMVVLLGCVAAVYILLIYEPLWGDLW